MPLGLLYVATLATLSCYTRPRKAYIGANNLLPIVLLFGSVLFAPLYFATFATMATLSCYRMPLLLAI